jgi:ketosteroid isomerase-like protein
MSTAPVQASIRAAMAATNELFDKEVFGNRKLEALDQIYTADARILPPGGAMVVGRDGIKKFWAGLIAATGATSAALETVEVNEAGDGLIEIGRATITTPSGQIDAKYVVNWRQEDGRWKWDIDIWNMNA